jgi:hypothetical protein
MFLVRELLLIGGALVDGVHVLPPVEEASRPELSIVMMKLLLNLLILPSVKVKEHSLLVFVPALYLHVQRKLSMEAGQTGRSLAIARNPVAQEFNWKQGHVPTQAQGMVGKIVWVQPAGTYAAKFESAVLLELIMNSQDSAKNIMYHLKQSSLLPICHHVKSSVS